MKYKEPTPEEYLLIADKVRSGEYFREARAMYDVGVHDTMAERYFYMLVTGIALFTFLIALLAANSLYPLSRAVPFTYAINDTVEDVPRLIALRSDSNQTASEAVLFFLAKNFVQLREQYSINTLERNASGLRSQSSDQVFADYQHLMDTSTPDSPVTLYQRHSVRNINVLSVAMVPGKNDAVTVEYEASVENANGSKKTRYKAELTFNYSGVELDEKTGKVKPLQFKVLQYRTQPIQDEKR